MLQHQSFRPLRRGDFAFFGFEGLEPLLDEKLASVGIRGGDPVMSVHERVVFIPRVRMPAGDGDQVRFTHHGGLVSLEGEPIELAQSRRLSGRWGARVLGGTVSQGVVPPAHTVEEEVLYLGWYFQHFGHFLMESLARTWSLSEVPPSTKVVFHGHRNLKRTSVTGRILDALGVPPERVLPLTEPTLLKRVIVPEPLVELSYSVHERFPDTYRRIAAGIVDDAAVSQQPVYLSRRLLPGHLRHIVGEFELEEVLRENGCRIAYPEMMTFEDQVRLMNQHRHIISSAGSAAYNILFSLDSPTLHILTEGIPRADYFLTPKIAGAVSAYCNCLGDGDRPAINTTPQLADLPRIFSYLEAQGFLQRRVRASLAVRIPDLRAAFDEGWFYAMVRDVLPGESLSVEIEREALHQARTSWPVSWLLARYYMQRGDPRWESVLAQFGTLLAQETNVARLAKFQDDVESSLAEVLAQCSAEQAADLVPVLATHLLLKEEEVRQRGAKKVERAGRGRATSHLARRDETATRQR